MKITKVKVLFWMLLILSGFSALFSAPRCSAKVYREKCGENATWEYNTKTKVLKISGKGAVTETIAAEEKEGYWGDGDDTLDVKKIIISEGITALDCPEGLFGYIHPLRTKGVLQLPDSLEYIGSMSFGSQTYYDWNTDITIPKNVNYIAPVAILLDSWRYGEELPSLSVADDNPYFCTIDGVLFSKDKKSLICYPQCKLQEEYTVPSSVREIAPMAFHYAYHLKRVILPDGLKKLGGGAFFECTNLEYVNLSDKMKIKSITDYDTTNIARVPGVWDCRHAHEQDDYYREESDIFYKQAVGVYVKRAATENRAGTFEGTAIQSIHIPNSVKYLSSNTFFNDTRISTFTILREISFGKDFSGEINTGDSQSGMKTLTLHGGSDLKISIPKSNKKYCVEDGILYNKEKSIVYYASSYDYKDKTLILPETVKKIANGAFTNCYYPYSIRHIIVQGDLESIGYNAFAGSEIETFTCNGKINEIGEWAFADCYRLETVKIKEVEEIADSAFWGCDSLSLEDIPKSREQKLEEQLEETLLAFRQLIEEAYSAHLPFGRARMEWRKAVGEVES